MIRVAATRSSSRLWQSSVGRKLGGGGVAASRCVGACTTSGHAEVSFLDRRSFWSRSKNNTEDASTTAASTANTSSTAPTATPTSSNDDTTLNNPSFEDTNSNVLPSAESTTNNTSSVDDTLNQLFAENASTAASTATDALQVATDAWSPTWYNVADQAIVFVKYFHETTGLEYGWSIVGVTALLRFGLFPVMISAQASSSRMAHLQPELNQMRARYEALGTPSRQDQIEMGTKMRSLFKRYNVNPLKATIPPLVQLPLFMGMFFGLQKMDRIYPEELANGGMLWFPDLTAPDPYYILPFMSGITFLAMIELGKDTMTASNPAQGKMMLNLFRLMAVGMVPFLTTFDTSMLCYWTANNTLTLAQAALLNQKSVRDALGIWEKPKPIPGQEPESLKDMLEKVMKTARGQPTTEAQEIQQHNQAVETKKRAESILRQARMKRKGITGRKA